MLTGFKHSHCLNNDIFYAYPQYLGKVKPNAQLVHIVMCKNLVQIYLEITQFSSLFSKTTMLFLQPH